MKKGRMRRLKKQSVDWRWKRMKKLLSSFKKRCIRLKMHFLALKGMKMKITKCRVNKWWTKKELDRAILNTQSN